MRSISLSLYTTLFLSLFFSQFVFSQQKTKKLKGKDEVVYIATTYGEIVLLLSDKTPEHKKNFIKLAKDGYYDGTSFHRVLKDFIIQGGDPNTRTDGDSSKVGIGNPGYTINSEFDSTLTHEYGMVGAARQNNEINPDKSSSGSQFYIVQAKEGAHHLDNDYTIFGIVLEGMDIIEKIAEIEIDNDGKPLKRIEINIKVVKEKRKSIQKKYDLGHI